MKEKSCGAVVFRGKKYLLLHYESGHWDFPKGHMERGESEEQTAIREVKEETGLDVDIIPGFMEKITYFFKKNGRLIGKDVIFLIGRAKSEDARLSYEHKAYKWLAYEEALELITFKNSRNVLKKAHDFLKKMR